MESPDIQATIDPQQNKRNNSTGSKPLNTYSVLNPTLTDPVTGATTKLVCIDAPIIVPCTNCFEAAWKYRDSGNSKKGRTRLTDLTTNPEEKTSPEGTNLVLDCFVQSCNASQPICQVQTDLASRLNAWEKCEGGSPSACDDDICEDLSSQQACTPLP